jgi:hypothetical protein
MLRLVLDNLLSRPLENMCTQGYAMPEIDETSDEYSMVFFVPDNGEGFEEDFEGTCIGTTTVQSIVHRHGGRAWAEGREAKRATFSTSRSHGSRNRGMYNPDKIMLVYAPNDVELILMGLTYTSLINGSPLGARARKR